MCHFFYIEFCLFLCLAPSLLRCLFPPSFSLCTIVGLNALTLAVGDNGKAMLMGSSRGRSLHAAPAAFSPLRARDCQLAVKARVPTSLLSLLTGENEIRLQKFLKINRYYKDTQCFYFKVKTPHLSLKCASL